MQQRKLKIYFTPHFLLEETPKMDVVTFLFPPLFVFPCYRIKRIF